MLRGLLKKTTRLDLLSMANFFFSVAVGVRPHKDIKQLYSSIFNMMGLLHSCSQNACAGINNNLSPSLEHDVQFTDVASNLAT